MTENTTTTTGKYVVYHNGPQDQMMAVPETLENRLTAGLHYPVTTVFAETSETALAAVQEDAVFGAALIKKKEAAAKSAQKQENKLDGLHKTMSRLGL